jgi:hypothetical protein
MTENTGTSGTAPSCHILAGGDKTCNTPCAGALATETTDKLELSKVKRELDESYSEKIDTNEYNLKKLNHQLSIITNKIKVNQNKHKLKNKMIVILFMGLLGSFVFGLAAVIIYAYVFKKQLPGLEGMTNVVSNMLNNAGNMANTALNTNNMENMINE